MFLVIQFCHRKLFHTALVMIEFIRSNYTFTMLYTIVAILLILWLLGVTLSFTLGGLIHILLVIAIIVVLVRIINGEKVIK